MLSLEENTTKVELDILPYIVKDDHHPDRDNQYEIALPGTQWYRRPLKVHRNVGVDNDSVICLRSVGKKCPICDYRDKRAKEGADKEELKELYPKPRSLYVVVPLNLKKFEARPMIWDMSDFLFQEILNDALDEDDENRAFPDLESGKTLSMRIKWKTLGTGTFPDVRSIDFIDRDPYDEEILDQIPCLDDVLKVMDYNELHDMFFEESTEVDGGTLEDIKEEAAPVRTRRPAKEEEEEEEAPTTRRRKHEDVEEEEAPTNRRRTPARTETAREEPTTTRRRPAKEEEEDEEEAPPTRTRGKKQTEENKCPFGHRFGVDTDKTDDCENCDVWDACIDAKTGK